MELLRSLGYFVVVAEELNFGRAAGRLHISQPALSQSIKALEHRMGLALFERNRRYVALTDAGRTLVPKARELLAHADELESLVTALAKREPAAGRAAERAAPGR
jgi:DNA-binding transcriptional LysR family regulator